MATVRLGVMSIQLSFQKSVFSMNMLKACVFSGVRGAGIKKNIFEMQNSLKTLEKSIILLKDDVKKLAITMQLMSYSRSLEGYFQDFMDVINFEDDLQKQEQYFIFLCGCHKCSRMLSFQYINRMYLINIKNNVDVKNSYFFFEGWLDDNELFFENMFDAVAPHFLQQGVNIKEIDKSIPWIGKDLSEYLLEKKDWQVNLFKD